MASAPFNSLDDFCALLSALPARDGAAFEAAQARNGQLTKPAGALGRLEELALWYASWRGAARPVLDRVQVVVFAGNHGVSARGVSAFPPEVTQQMVANFHNGGAAINQLAGLHGAQVEVHALELDRPTADFTQAPAMSEAECLRALQIGWAAVDPKGDVLVTGEMGIGNTTAAAAIAAALFGGKARDWVGRGSGVDDHGLRAKTDVVEAGLKRHPSHAPLDVLRCLGGREIAAMAGAIVAARMARIPVILDGFINTAAAAVLEQVASGALDHTVAGHCSDEAAHGALLENLNKPPLLSLDLRLGEGSGAAVALGVLKSAVACQSGMATFAEAQVSDG